jgi:hypothetical protein
MMPAGDGRMRASSADRERAVDVVKAGFAEGRLTKEEHDDRVCKAYAARTYAELGGVTADLPGGQMVAPYGQPYLPPYLPVRRRTNSLAVASLICGLSQPFLGVTTIPAIILGYVARDQIRHTGEDGGRLATAGLVLGWVGLGITMLVILLVVAVSARHAAPASPGPG